MYFYIKSKIYIPLKQSGNFMELTALFLDWEQTNYVFMWSQALVIATKGRPAPPNTRKKCTTEPWTSSWKIASHRPTHSQPPRPHLFSSLLSRWRGAGTHITALPHFKNRIVSQQFCRECFRISLPIMPSPSHPAFFYMVTGGRNTHHGIFALQKQRNTSPQICEECYLILFSEWWFTIQHWWGRGAGALSGADQPSASSVSTSTHTSRNQYSFIP